MAEIRIIDSDTFKTSFWSGGSTTELFIWPEGASYAERRFSFRISSAEVELERSDFTALPGVERRLTPLCREGFRLEINGAEAIRLDFGSVLAFSGSDSVTCYGSGRDLNLMLKGERGDMLCVEAGAEFFVPHAGFVFLYAVEDLELTVDGSLVCINAGGFARLSGSGLIGTSGRLVLFAVY